MTEAVRRFAVGLSALPLVLSALSLVLTALPLVLAALSLGLYSGPANAAAVTEVRVGPHPEFTRVVFQLDSPSRYRVERNTGDDGVTEILVSLDATAEPRDIKSRSDLINGVSVEAGPGGKAVARIRLRDSSLRLREMILTNPPRIVLDVMAGKKLAAVPTPPVPKPAPGAAPVPKPAPEAAPVPVARAPSEPRLGDQPLVEVEEVAEVEIEEEALEEPLAPETAPPEAELAAEEDLEAEAETDLELADAESTPVAPAPVPRPTRPQVAPTPTPLPAPGETLFGVALPMGITPLRAGIAAGLMVVALVVWMLLRRRSLPGDLDASMLGEEADEAGFDSGLGAHQAREDEIGTGFDRTLDGREMGGAPGGGLRGEGVGSTPRKPEPGLFDGFEQGGKAMDMDGLGSDSPMGDLGGGGDSGEVARLIRELDARVGRLEASLGESNEARERLERQVAAQAEELRVQRAAIARTQRALRGMNRGDEEATEPALRDPKAGPRA